MLLILLTLLGLFLLVLLALLGKLWMLGWLLAHGNTPGLPSPAVAYA